MKAIVILIVNILLLVSCNSKNETSLPAKKIPETKTSSLKESDKIKVLNFATFHMGTTTDAYSVDYDHTSDKSKNETYAIAKALAAFKPTVICVERVPSETQNLLNDYQKYLKDDNHKPNYHGEIGLVAYPLGKIAEVSKIYGIDERETAPYNYNIGNELKNQIDTITVAEYVKSTAATLEAFEHLSTLEKLKAVNTPEYHDLFVNFNANMLTHVATKDGFEGADEAAKLYRRNLRIYSNINKLPLTKNDRVFIIMGGAHTAMLNDFMKRSSKYELVRVNDYLNI